MTVWCQWQHHLPIVMSHSCLEPTQWMFAVASWSSDIEHFIFCNDPTTTFNYKELVHSISVKNKQL